MTEAKKPAPKRSSSSSSNKSVWDAIGKVVDYVGRHGDEAANTLRNEIADLRPGKTPDTGDTSEPDDTVDPATVDAESRENA